MDREDVIRMAREAGLQWTERDVPETHDALERFAVLVTAKEREACAKACEEEDVAPTDDAVGVQQCIAAAIRARGEQLKEKNYDAS